MPKLEGGPRLKTRTPQPKHFPPSNVRLIKVVFHGFLVGAALIGGVIA